MNFEELQQRWKTHDAKLETILNVNVAQLKTTNFGSMVSALDRVRRAIWIELLLTAATLLLLGSFIADHIKDLRYVAPGAVLHICAIVLVAACVRQLVAGRRVDYSDPLIDVQRRLTLLRMSRIRTSKWTLLLAPALWAPFLLVTMKGVLGVDVYSAFDSKWIAANVLGSIAFIPLMLWVAHRYGDRLSRSPLLQGLANDIAGRSLNEAVAFADKLAKFEHQNEVSRPA